MQDFKNNTIQKKGDANNSSQAFKRFVDFMYEHPEMMEEFPRTIIFKDDTAIVEFAGDVHEKVKK